jgi:hypothetical protein
MVPDPGFAFVLVDTGGGIALGRDVHASVNLSRSLQGLPYANACPSVHVSEDGDSLGMVVGGGCPVHPWLVDCCLLWDRPSGSPGFDCLAMVLSIPCSQVVCGVPSESKARWVGFAEIEVGVPLELSALAGWGGLLVPGGAAVLRVGLAEVGLAPFFWEWVQHENRV